MEWTKAITIIIAVLVGVGSIILWGNGTTNVRIDDFKAEMLRSHDRLASQIDKLENRMEELHTYRDPADFELSEGYNDKNFKKASK